jgi:methionyl-tRNA formyltransferase
MINKVLIIGDDLGIPQALRFFPTRTVGGIVAAEVRPHQHKVIKDLAGKLGLPFIIQPKATSSAYASFVKQVRLLKPDLIFVNSYSMLIRPDILAIPEYGAVNVHPALLPEYRGCNPTQWSLLNDETETGVTMHYMDEHFDTGNIFAQRRVPILFDDTWLDIQARIGAETDKMFNEEIPKLLAGTNKQWVQDESRAKYWPRRHPEDGLIDWRQSVHYIYNLIRALVKPHPGAFYVTSSGEKKVLDQYMSLPQITAVKYGVEGGQELKDESIMFLPLKNDDHFPLLKLNERDLAILGITRKPMTKKRFTTWFENVQKRNDTVLFAVNRLTDSYTIGSCLLHHIDPYHRSAEFSIYIDDTFNAGRRYETASILLLKKYAFSELKLNSIWIEVDVPTDMTFYQGLGFRQQAVQTEFSLVKSVHPGKTIMRISRDD